VPWRYAAIYGLLATGWIVFSDFLLSTRDGGPPWRFDWATAKGVLFVLVTTGLLYILLKRVTAQVAAAEQQCVQLEARWRRALDGVGDGLWDWQVKMGDVYFSPWMERMLGYAPGEFRSHVSDWKSRVHPDDLPAVEEQVARHLAGGTSSYCSEHRVRRKDGTYAWVLDRGVVVERDEQGRALRMIGTHHDVTLRHELKQQLAEQALRYRALFEHSPNPMWIYDVETKRILAVNDFAVERYGYARERFLELDIFALRPPEDVPALLADLSKPPVAVQSSGPWRHRLASGEIIWVDILSHAIRWNGRSARVVVAHDVTARERVALEIEASEQKFRAIFHSANDAIFTTDEELRVASANVRAEELLRAAADQLIGRPLREFFPARQPDGTESGTKAREILERVWSERVPAFEWQLERRDGSVVAAELTFSGLVHDGRRSVIVVARDITERQRAHRELQLLHAALQATPAGIVVTDANGAIEWVNPAFTHLTGFTLEEVQGQNPRMLRSGQHDAAFYRTMWQTILRGEVWSGEVQNRRKDGTCYYERMTIAPVRNRAGTITNFVAVKEDITNERRLEQQLARSQRLESVGMLASGIAHDLNNVLTPIVLSIELLRAERQLAPSAIARMDLVAQAAQRGANIVKQVLTFARGVEGERTVVQPRYLLKEVAQLVEETFPRIIEVTVDAERDLPAVRGDVTQLHQVLLNLAVNARDAMPRGGRLVFSARVRRVDATRASALSRIPPGAYVELAVADTGTGITEEVLEHMFEPFFSTKPRGKGTGLGLSTVYGIVRSHEGTVEVDTELGSGTTFRVLLPAVPADAAAAAAPTAAAALSGSGKRVLVVDDEAPIRTLLQQMLRRHGFEVVLAADGVEALQIFQLRPEAYQFAIVDLVMPRMRGAALIHELRALAPNLKIVCASGYADERADGTESPRLSDVGVDVFLPKPFREEELVNALHEAERSAAPGPAEKKV